MKRIFFLSCISTMILNAGNEWIKPTPQVCKSIGGEYKDNTCFSNWEDANKICKATNSHLASKKVFDEVVLKCGGELEEIYSNKRNRKYQNCYKSLGFSENYSYWTSNTNPNAKSHAQFMTFYVGDGIYDDKKVDNAVVCKN